VGERKAETAASPVGRDALDNLRVGRLAEYAGWMTPEQLGACLHRQKAALRAGQSAPRLVEIALEEGYLSRRQAEALLRLQELHRPPAYDRTFGAIAVMRGFGTQEQVDECLHEQEHMLQDREEAPMLGEILELKGYMTAEQVRSVLETQAGQGLGPLADLRRLAAASPAEASAPRAPAPTAEPPEPRGPPPRPLPRSAAPVAEAQPRPVQPRRPIGAFGSPADKTPSDLRLGRMAYYVGWIRADQLVTCLRRKKRALEAGKKPPRFGETAVAEGFMTPGQVNALLHVQALRCYDFSLARLVVRRGLASQEQVDACLQEQQAQLRRGREAPALPLLLVERGLLRNDQVKALIEEQARHGNGLLADLQRLAPDTPEAQVRERIAAPPKSRRAPKALPHEPPTLVYRCLVCRKTVEPERWARRRVCPECGARRYVALPIECDAIGYSIADRTTGPSIEDGRLGLMAYFAGWMTELQITACLHRQKALAREAPPAPKFGEVAVEQGFLSREQVRALLKIQVIHRPVQHERTFGAIAVRAGYAAQDQVDECLREQVRLLQENLEAPRIGLLLVERKYLTRKQVKAVLHVQAQRGEGPLAELPQVEKRRRGNPLRPLRQAIRTRGGLAATASTAVLLLAVAALLTGWFGAYTPREADGLVGCTACGSVFRAAEVDSTRCPACGTSRALSPLVRCEKCGHVFAYGVLGTGLRCPKCGSDRAEAVVRRGDVPPGWNAPPRGSLAARSGKPSAP